MMVRGKPVKQKTMKKKGMKNKTKRLNRKVYKKRQTKRKSLKGGGNFGNEMAARLMTKNTKKNYTTNNTEEKKEKLAREIFKIMELFSKSDREDGKKPQSVEEYVQGVKKIDSLTRNSLEDDDKDTFDNYTRIKNSLRLQYGGRRFFSLNPLKKFSFKKRKNKQFNEQTENNDKNYDENNEQPENIIFSTDVVKLYKTNEEIREKVDELIVKDYVMNTNGD